MTIQELLSRARSASGKKIRYKLGAGGLSPQAPLPANISSECDCSGLVCWALGVSRRTDHPLYVKFNGGWLNTDGIVHDAKTVTGFFQSLDKARPGCLIVYPSRKQPARVGHVGIVTKAGVDGKPLAVLHCSSGNFRKFGDAIRETGPDVFAGPATIYAWFEGLEEG